MNYNNEKNILNIINLWLPLFIVFSFILIIFVFYIEEKNFLEQERINLKKEFINKNNQAIKQQINNIVNIIGNEQKTTEEALVEELNEFLSTAHTIALSIYKQNKNTKTPKEIKKLIIDVLREIRFNDGRGYFFIYDKNATNIMLPPNPTYEGLDFSNHQDKKGKYIIKDMIEALKTKDNYVIDWYWYKPGSFNKQSKKIGIVKNFEPFDWFIGTGEYVEDFQNKIQGKLLRNLKEVRFGDSGYIFILDKDYNYLAHAKKEYIGNNAFELKDTTNSVKVLKTLASIAKNGGGFYTYIQREKPGETYSVTKTSYVKYFPQWKWVVGTGYYEDDFKKEFGKKELELDKKLAKYVFETLMIISIISLLLILIFLSFSNRLKKLFKKHTKEINNHIEKNNKQYELLAQQSKMAAMGEMIGNIAHQWRQPLSAITSVASVIKLKKQLNVLDEKECDESLDSIMSSAKYLSTTIDDFRNYFIPNKNKQTFTSLELLGKLDQFTRSDSVVHQINFIKNDIEEFTISTYQNELLQVLLNMINNSKDEFKKNDIENKYIFITFTKVENDAVITLKDSAGGIEEEIINRIFEPYFTTKHKSKGTGIGLYMSLEITKKHLNGDIKVENEEYEFENLKLSGAKFTITIPVN